MRSQLQSQVKIGLNKKVMQKGIQLTATLESESRIPDILRDIETTARHIF